MLQDSDGVEDGTGMNDSRGVTSSTLWESLKTTCLHLQRADLASMCDRRDLDGASSSSGWTCVCSFACRIQKGISRGVTCEVGDCLNFWVGCDSCGVWTRRRCGYRERCLVGFALKVAMQRQERQKGNKYKTSTVREEFRGGLEEGTAIFPRLPGLTTRD